MGVVIGVARAKKFIKRTKVAFFSLFFFGVFFLSGCANLFSVHREIEVDQGTGALIDIKQRAILVSKHPHSSSGAEGDMAAGGAMTVVCAEPSPDALSAYAAELAAEVNLPKGAAAQVASGLQESSSFVGLRTQSIQLLRDGFYRLCEGYMSGALDKAKYDILMRRYQKYMVALLAIEQLTGAVRSPTVTISTKGAAEAAQSISTLRANLSSVEARLVELKKKKAEKEAEKSKEGADEQKLKDLDADIAACDSEIAQLEADKVAIAGAIENARGLSVSGEASAVVSTVGLPSSRSDQHILAVAGTVESIVTRIIETDDTGQLCWAYLADPDMKDAQVRAACFDFINNMNQRAKLLLQSEELLIRTRSNARNLNETDIEELIKRLKSDDLNGWGLFNLRR